MIKLTESQFRDVFTSNRDRLGPEGFRRLAELTGLTRIVLTRYLWGESVPKTHKARVSFVKAMTKILGES